MKTIHNPFITRGYIPDECFCDRVSETQRLAKSLMNGNDVVLFSPRRMGKTGLITHVFEREEIKRSYYTFLLIFCTLQVSGSSLSFWARKCSGRYSLPEKKSLINS